MIVFFAKKLFINICKISSISSIRVQSYLIQNAPITNLTISPICFGSSQRVTITSPFS